MTREIKFVVAILMPGAFRPLSQTFADRADADAALAAIPPWSQRAKDKRNKIRGVWYRTGTEAVVPVYEYGSTLEAIVDHQERIAATN